MKFKISKSFNKSKLIQNFKKNIIVLGKKEIRKNERSNIFLLTKEFTSVFIFINCFEFSKNINYKLKIMSLLFNY